MLENADETLPETSRPTEHHPESHHWDIRRFVTGVVAAIVVAILFDVGVYRGFGPTGWAAFFGGSLLSYFFATIGNSSRKSSWLIALMMCALVARLTWMGSVWQCCIGLVLLPTYAMSRLGIVPYLMTVFLYCVQSTFAGFVSLGRCLLKFPFGKFHITPALLLPVALPLLAVLIFGSIFIAANPDLSKLAQDWVTNVEQWLSDFFTGMDLIELDVFIVIFWLALGQLLPLMQDVLVGQSRDVEKNEIHSASQKEAALFQAFRNTLLAVIGLFVIYLVFEFQTLWFREFPQGFYYAGYAHQGAAWLTFALALATAMLSLIFRGAIQADPRLPQLKRLAWIWSAANFVLALAVYNRMWIYVDFNGMTRMRVVALFGISTVVVGFLLVIWKIRFEHGFFWLIQRQLWAFVIAIYLLTITPVDYLIHTYNARQILSGNLAPSVQITEHPVDESGWLALVPLLDCEDEFIRNGIREKLADIHRRDTRLDSVSKRKRRWSSQPDHWTARQLVRDQLMQALDNHEATLLETPHRKGTPDWDRYKAYAYQWY